MIKFRALMQAIQDSIHSASKAVEQQGEKTIEDFFIKVEDEDNNEGDFYVTHRPKMVAMEFPSRTSDGIETVKVNVPLITLSPMSTQKITEVKFTAKLEVSTGEDDEIYVAFPKASKHGIFSKEIIPGPENTTIEITLTGAEPPEGLQKVIEGYERAIRAQIPG